MEDYRFHYLFSYGENRVQARHGFLKDHGDLVSPDETHLCLGLLYEVFAFEDYLSTHNLSRRIRYEPHDRKGCDALPAATLADDPQGLTFAHGETYIINCPNNAILGVKIGFKAPHH